MATHRISVTVENNTIQVSPDTLVMTAADEVQWAGTNPRQFSIAFDDDGPFGERNLAHALAVSAQKPKARGRFKYTVISAENPGLKLDPVIIVEDPPTGGNP
ncbi:MAG: hypothetical protein ABIS67_00455 [Candidatus Eisenbacteria bacterium]